MVDDEMARRRYLSTEISVDKAVNKIAASAGGDFAALLYTWMIPHAEDDGRLGGDPWELRLRVMPGRPDKTEDDVERALTLLAEFGLISWGWDDTDKLVIELPPESFYKHQTYIPAEKRRTATTIVRHRTSPNFAEEQRETAQNTVSPSPSPSPSPSLTTMCVPGGTHVCVKRKRNDYSPEFETFWKNYPPNRRVEKIKAAKAWTRRLKEGHTVEEMTAAAKHYAAECEQKNREPDHIKHPATFIGPDKPFLDYIKPPEECWAESDKDRLEWLRAKAKEMGLE